METKANYVAVGIFTLVLVFVAFGLIYWSFGLGGGGDLATLRVRIPGSAAGLARGSAVLFNGVKVGDVRRVFIDVTNPTVAIADAEVDRLSPITRSTKADIGLAGLTGQANIELRGGDPKEPNLIDEAAQAGKVAEITANPSAVTNLLETAQDIFKRADSVLGTLENFVTDVRTPLTQTFKNAEVFSEALSRNADGVDQFLANFTELSRKLGQVSDRLDSTLASAEDLIKAVDREKVGTIVANVQDVTERLKTASAQVDGIMKNVDETVVSVRTLSQNATNTLAKADGVLDGAKAGVDAAAQSISKVAGDASGTLARVDGILDKVDAAKVNEAIDNIASASKDARTAASDVAAFTDRISQRTNDIDKIITDARGIAEKLNQASTRVDGVLAKVDGLLGSSESENVIAEATATLKSFRQVADTLNARIGPITEGLARFSGQGLRDAEALIQDSRRSINRIEEAISALERNPQRILSGGDGTVRQFDGRTRR